MNEIHSKDLEVIVFRSVLKAVSFLSLAASHNSKSAKKKLCVNEVAALTGLTKSNIYSKINYRSIPFQKDGGKLVFDEDELIAWLNKKNRKKEVMNGC